MAFQPSDLWNWRGTVGRGKYVAIGLILFAVKHNIDRVIGITFDRPWPFVNYWFFDEPGGIDDAPFARWKFYGLLVAVALPFIWTGVVLTLRRLRSAGLPSWMVAFFFVPFLNLFFFLLLGLVPPRAAGGERSRSNFGERLTNTLGRMIPDSQLGSAAMSLLVMVPLAIGATLLSVRTLGDYGWGLFVGLPFFLGLTSALLYGFHRPRSLGGCLAVSLLSIALVSLALLVFAIEGVICLVMAAPLGAVLAVFGGFIGYVIQRRPDYSAGAAFQTCALAVLALPVFMLLEHQAQFSSPLYEVKTSVVINASPEKIWPNLVAFTELPPPDERLFRTGIAYPVRAEIEGRGVGAVRRCVFSTGAFVEPIEVWDEPRLLRFGVTAQPPVMQEVSPYDDLRPPHLENYLHSRRGQFLLTPLSDGTTLLEGTTWYENRFWPGAYWHLWSDHIIHQIHLRVLDHIKHLAEQKG